MVKGHLRTVTEQHNRGGIPHSFKFNRRYSSGWQLESRYKIIKQAHETSETCLTNNKNKETVLLQL